MEGGLGGAVGCQALHHHRGREQEQSCQAGVSQPQGPQTTEAFAFARQRGWVATEEVETHLALLVSQGDKRDLWPTVASSFIAELNEWRWYLLSVTTSAFNSVPGLVMRSRLALKYLGDETLSKSSNYT